MLYANDNKTNMLFKTPEGEETISPYFEVERLIKRIPEDIENEAIEIFYRSKHRTGRFRILTTDLCDINVVAKICFSNHFVFPANYKQLVYGEIIDNTTRFWIQKLTLLNISVWVGKILIINLYSYTTIPI